VGGRTLNAPLGPAYPEEVVEAGGQWIGPTQDALAALAAELGIATFPTHGEGEHLIEFDGRVRRYRGAIPRISPAVLADFEQARLRLDAMARRVPLDAPWTARHAERWDAQTFASWLRRNVVTRGGRALFAGVTEGVWAAEPGDGSLLHWLFYARSAGGVERLVSTEGGAQQDRFVGGSQRIALAEQVRPRLEAPVRGLRHGPDGVVARADGGVEVSARRAVVAIPPTLAGRIAYDPPLPGLRDQLTQRMPQGAVIKRHAVYPEPFWRADGLTGQAGSDAGPAKVIFDNSPPSARRASCSPSWRASSPGSWGPGRRMTAARPCSPPWCGCSARGRVRPRSTSSRRRRALRARRRSCRRRARLCHLRCASDSR
jgi:monoamine oxidase